MSLSASIQSRSPGSHSTWMAAKIVAVAAAVIIFSLTVAVLQARFGIVPSDDAITWLDGGE